jgi:hypothetical protein
MTLEPGCRFIVAPHFHMPANWPQRLSVGAGVEETDGCFVPYPSWRPPTTDELAVLVRVSDRPTSSEELEASVCLFQLPGHLQSEWWNLLERAAGMLGRCSLPGFEAFVSQVVEFLAFKGLPVPEGARCDVVVSKPGSQSVPWRPEAHAPMGLRCSLAPSILWPRAGELSGHQFWGGINLGDEPISVVLINLSWRQLDAALRCRCPGQPSPETAGELAERFMVSCSDYPLVRLVLGPGEGYRLPRQGLILDVYPESKQEPEVLLLISHEGHRFTQSSG